MGVNKNVPFSPNLRTILFIFSLPPKLGFYLASKIEENAGFFGAWYFLLLSNKHVTSIMIENQQ